MVFFPCGFRCICCADYGRHICHRRLAGYRLNNNNISNNKNNNIYEIYPKHYFALLYCINCQGFYNNNATVILCNTSKHCLCLELSLSSWTQVKWDVKCMVYLFMTCTRVSLTARLGTTLSCNSQVFATLYTTRCVLIFVCICT